MANVLHRINKTYLTSVNEPDYPIESWIWNPNISAVVGFNPRYWIITGDNVTLMNQSERNAVDAALLELARDDLVTQLTSIEDLNRSIILVLLDEFNNHANKINSILDAVDAASSLADLKTRIAAITDYPQRNITQIRQAIRNKLGS